MAENQNSELPSQIPDANKSVIDDIAFVPAEKKRRGRPKKVKEIVEENITEEQDILNDLENIPVDENERDIETENEKPRKKSSSESKEEKQAMVKEYYRLKHNPDLKHR